MLAINGKKIANFENSVTITQAEYNNLTDAQKTDGTVYYISDNHDLLYTRLIHMIDIVGADGELAHIADGTIIGAIVDLYNRLGGLTFSVNQVDKTLEATYSDEVTPANPVTSTSEYSSEAEKIENLDKLMGDETSLNAIGYSTVAGAILGLYQRLNGCTFRYNADLDTIQAIYDDEVQNL